MNTELFNIIDANVLRRREAIINRYIAKRGKGNAGSDTDTVSGEFDKVVMVRASEVWYRCLVHFTYDIYEEGDSGDYYNAPSYHKVYNYHYYIHTITEEKTKQIIYKD